MANRRKQRRRWSLVPRVIDFNAIDIRLTINDVMADLEHGWTAHPSPSASVPEPARSAA